MKQFLLCYFLPAAQIFTLLYIAACILSLLLLKFKKKEPVFKSCFFLIFPFSQYIAFSVIEQYDPLEATSFFYGFLIFVICLSLCSNIPLLLVVIRCRQSKQLEVESCADEMRHEMMKKRSDETKEMCVHFQEKLKQVSSVVQAKDGGEAARLFKELNQEIAAHRKEKFCQNLIVDAVMQEKKKLCAQSQISLNAEISLPDSCPVSEYHLCSIFSNLMDNAIHACCRLSPEEKRRIELRCRPVNDYLFIQCENPVPKTRNLRSSFHHGYGLQILKETADKYDGTVKFQTKQGHFLASLSLHMEVFQ